MQISQIVENLKIVFNLSDFKYLSEYNPNNITEIEEFQ